MRVPAARFMQDDFLIGRANFSLDQHIVAVDERIAEENHSPTVGAPRRATSTRTETGAPGGQPRQHAAREIEHPDVTAELHGQLAAVGRERWVRGASGLFDASQHTARAVEPSQLTGFGFGGVANRQVHGRPAIRRGEVIDHIFG